MDDVIKKYAEIKPEDIKDDRVCGYEKMYSRAKAQMDQRTKKLKFFAKVSHMENLYNDATHSTKLASEGSTQAYKRKTRSQVIQRPPDGELITQFDKNDKRHIITDFLFRQYILESNIPGKDRYKDIVKTFNVAYDYGFACVRSGFDKSAKGDIHVTYDLMEYQDIFPNPDCKSIEEAEWYIIREWISRSELEYLLTEDGNVKDPTYNAETIKFLLGHQIKDGQDWYETNIQDHSKGVGKVESVEIRTLYRRGDSEFVTYSPTAQAVLRTVKNYDPQKQIPLHFLILEPDSEYPLGASIIHYSLGEQQFLDAFMTSVYNNFLLAVNPPLKVYGNVTTKRLKMVPRAVWNIGTNPNAKIEPHNVETTTLTQYNSIREGGSANIARNLNIQDQTIASDAHVPGWSKTPQGVEAQQQDKTITVNQLQKRIEIFFSEWANHALRSYISSMSGKQWVTVDEETRRKIWDIEEAEIKKIEREIQQGVVNPLTVKSPRSIVNGDKIEIDFNELSYDMLNFKVRSGSLIQSRHEEQQKKLQDLIVPISQMLGALPDNDKAAFTQVLMQMVQRLVEEADIDISESSGQKISDSLVVDALKATMMQVQQINDTQNKMLQQMQGGAQQQEQPENGQQAQPMPPQEQAQPMPPEAQQMPPEQAGQV